MSRAMGNAARGAIAAMVSAAGLAGGIAPAAADGPTPPPYRYPIYGWRGGYAGWEGPVAAALDKGLAFPALFGKASGAAPAYYPSYDYCYWQSRPIYDPLGHVVGDQPDWVCY